MFYPSCSWILFIMQLHISVKEDVVMVRQPEVKEMEFGQRKGKKQ